MFPLIYLFNGWATLALRVAVGLILVAHGFPKIKNIPKTSADFAGMGFKPGFVFGALAALIEFLGGLFLLGGFLTQAVAAVVAVEFFIIILWRLKRKSPFKGGLELDILMLAALCILLTQEPGAGALDAVFPFLFF
jgi:putative oxidoreductase